MTNIDLIINKYLKLFPHKSSSFIARVILDSEDVELTHSTIRQKIGQVRRKADYLETRDVIEELEPTRYEETDVTFFTHERIEAIAESRLEPYTNGNPNNILVIGDTQFPFEREGYLEHCRQVQEKYNCGQVIHIGDIKDSHASSFHDSDPDGYSAGEELDRTIVRTKEWYRVFPNVKVCLGNHDLIILRKAYKAGLSSRWIKGLAEVLETPNWEYDTEFIINGTMYTHTLGSNTLKAALLRGVNLVVGHEHSKAQIEYAASLDKLIWAMKVGSGVDDRKYAFNYAKTAPAKSIVSCAVVEDSIPHIIPMNL